MRVYAEAIWHTRRPISSDLLPSRARPRNVTLVWALFSVLTACAPHGDANAPARALTSNAARPEAPSAGPPTDTRATPAESDPEHEVGLQTLPVSGFENAVAVVPAHPHPVPLLVAAHGAGGDPAWECVRWARVARDRWFVLCPSGRSLGHGETAYYYPDHHALEREVVAMLGAARDEYGARIAPRGGVYVGYSQGATMGALMLVDHGNDFPHLLLIEGGSGDWTFARAQRYRATGGESVFIVCGTSGCAKRATASGPVLERAGLHAETRQLSGGHTELGDVGAAAEALLETLVSR